MIPKMAMMELDPYELTLYCHYKMTASEHGKCWKSNKTLADESGMSERKMQECRNILVTKGYITLIPTLDENGKNNAPPVITIINVWATNRKLYAKKEADPLAPHATPLAGDATPVAPHATKESVFKNSSRISNERKRSKPSSPSTPKVLKYPSDAYKYQNQHVEQYQKEHGGMLDILLKSWGMDLYKHITEMPLYDARQFITAHQDLERLHIPTDEYPEVIKTTRAKFAWRYSKGGAVQPSDIGGALTDYLQAKQAPKPAAQSTSQAQADAKAAHDYYEFFGKEMPHAK